MFLDLMQNVILTYQSGEDIEQLLENERQKNKRNPYWGCPKSNIG